MSKQRKKPTLVVVNHDSETLARYVPKPTGGFYRERFDIEDRSAFDAGFTEAQCERFRRGQCKGQDEISVDQPAPNVA